MTASLVLTTLLRSKPLLLPLELPEGGQGISGILNGLLFGGGGFALENGLMLFSGTGYLRTGYLG